MKKMTIVLALTLVPAFAFGAMTLPFTDNFNTGGPDNSWTYYGGVYSAANSGTHIVTYQTRQCMDVNDGSGWQWVFPTADDGAQAGSVIVEAWQYLGSDTGGAWARVGVGCRVNGTGWANAEKSGYWVYSDTDADDWFSVGRCFQNWLGTPPYDAPLGLRLYGPATCSRNAWHHWAIAVDGTTITGYSDTGGAYSVVWTGTDSTFSNGRCGIGNYLKSGSTQYSYTDSITIASWTAVDDWSLY
jgi:hypothetical protein